MPRLLPALLALLLLVTGCEVRRTDAPSPGPAPAADSASAPRDTPDRRAVMRPGRDLLELRLPTSNDALFYDESLFYAALDRETIPGLRTAGWEGGQYGFVRSPARTPGGLILSQLHEGLDIRPLERDARGEPLDTVVAVADGVVAYVNRGAGSSSYGRYVVVRHRWDRSPVYSLYAHLSSTAVSEGDSVRIGEALGQLGYTGRGTAQHRAHVHLEIGLLLNEHFQRWFDAYYGSRNFHGLYFGKNIAGVNPAALYRSLRQDATLSFAEFVRRQPVAYRLALPGDRPLDLLERYSWLAEGDVAPADTAETGAWVVSFTREAVPVRIARRSEPVAEPEVVYVAPNVRRGHLSTAGYLARGTDDYHLTRDGRAYVALLATSADGVPPWF
jgi:murein DD-endopeptidase MepM/ murein hydrolase activator NlpD